MAELQSSRRGFIGWMGKMGLAAVGGVAGLAALDKAAASADEKTVSVAWNCCHLAYPPNCPTSGGNPYCPSGYSMKTWLCCSGTAPWQRKYACGECTTGSSCYSASVCSAGWTVNPRGC